MHCRYPFRPAFFAAARCRWYSPASFFALIPLLIGRARRRTLHTLERWLVAAAAAAAGLVSTPRDRVMTRRTTTSDTRRCRAASPTRRSASACGERSRTRTPARQRSSSTTSPGTVLEIRTTCLEAGPRVQSRGAEARPPRLAAD